MSLRARRRLLHIAGLIGVFGAISAVAFAAMADWGWAIEVPGLGTGGPASVTSISCPSAGNCAAAGSFPQGASFVVSEKNGVWGTAIDVPYGVSDYLGSISCATAGSCAAGGSYVDRHEHGQAFVVNERHGVWGKPMKVPGTARLNRGDYASLNSISCAKPGFCAAGGAYADSIDHGQAFVVNEKNGVWGTAIEVPGSAALNLGDGAWVNSVSCTNARSCSGGGTYTSGDDEADPKAFVVDERNGVWGKAVAVPGVASLSRMSMLTALSCGAAGSCAAGGTYTYDLGDLHAFVVNETHGVWGKAIAMPGLAALNVGVGAQVHAISCAAAGSCAASGSYQDGAAYTQAFVMSEKNGIWRKAIEVPDSAVANAGGDAETDSISCATTRFCAAGGYYTAKDENEEAFVVNEIDGVWKNAITVPGTAALNFGPYAAVDGISCATASSCVAGGFYTDGSGKTRAFVTSP
jgi:hypothetical protein